MPKKQWYSEDKHPLKHLENAQLSWYTAMQERHASYMRLHVWEVNVREENLDVSRGFGSIPVN